MLRSEGLRKGKLYWVNI